jgi:hypothetical protein
MRVKLFVQEVRFKTKHFWGGQVYAPDQSDLENEINTWLSQNSGIRVINIKQSVIPRLGWSSAGKIARAEVGDTWGD